MDNRKQKRITVDSKQNSNISHVMTCIKIEMTDGNKYFIAESIKDFMNTIKKSNNSPLLWVFDVFDESICVNPNYIKTIREGRCVVVNQTYNTNDGERTKQSYYVIGSLEYPVLCERNEDIYIPAATEIYKKADEISW